MRRAQAKRNPKSPDSDDISFSMSDVSMEEAPAVKKNKVQSKTMPARTVTRTLHGVAKKAESKRQESFELSGSDFSVDFSDEFQTKKLATRVPERPAPVSKPKDNSAAAIMSKRVNTRHDKAASESFSISDDDIEFSDDEVSAPAPSAAARVVQGRGPASTSQPANSRGRAVQKKDDSLSFSISGDDIVFSDEDGESKSKNPPSRPNVGTKVIRKPSQPDPRASIDSDDIQFSGDSDSDLSGDPLRAKSRASTSRRVAESNMKLSNRLNSTKANNRYQDEESVTPSHTPSLGGSSFASEGQDDSRRGQDEDSRSESRDEDDDSDDGKPKIMMGDDLADLMSSVGLGAKPAVGMAVDEDDPLSGMNRVVQKFSDDENDDGEEEDDRSESFYRRYAEDARSESRDEDDDSDGDKPKIMMGDDIPPTISSEVSISRSLAVSSTQPKPQPAADLSTSGDDLIHPVTTSWKTFSVPPQPSLTLVQSSPSPPMSSSSVFLQQPTFIPHTHTFTPPPPTTLLPTVKVYLTSSETQTGDPADTVKSKAAPRVIRPPPEIVDLDPSPVYTSSAKQRTVALQVGSGNEVSVQVAFDPRDGGMLTEDSLYQQETLRQSITRNNFMNDTKKSQAPNATSLAFGAPSLGHTILTQQPLSSLGLSHSLINGPMSSWGVLSMAVQSMRAAAMMEKVQEASERQRQALETDLMLQDYMNATITQGQLQLSNSGNWVQAPNLPQPPFTPLTSQSLTGPVSVGNQPRDSTHGRNPLTTPPPAPPPPLSRPLSPSPGQVHTSLTQVVNQSPRSSTRRNSGFSDPGGSSPFPPPSRSSINARNKLSSSFNRSISIDGGSSNYEEDFEEDAGEEDVGLGGIKEEIDEEIEEDIQTEPSQVINRSRDQSCYDEEDDINEVAAAAAAEIKRGRSLVSRGSYSLGDAYSEVYEDDAQSETYTNDFSSVYSSFAPPQQQASSSKQKANTSRSLAQGRNPSSTPPGNFNRLSSAGGGVLDPSPSSSSLHRQTASFGGSRVGSVSVRRSSTFGGNEIPETNKLESLQVPLKSKPPPAPKALQQRPTSASRKTDPTFGRGDVPLPRPAWLDSQSPQGIEGATFAPTYPAPALTPAQITILRYHNLITSGALNSSHHGPFMATTQANLINNLAPSSSLAAASGLHFKAPSNEAEPQFLTESNHMQPSNLSTLRQELLQSASVAARGIKTSDLVGERSADNDLKWGVDKLKAKLQRMKAIPMSFHSAGDSLKQRAIQDLREKLSGGSNYLGVGQGSVRVEREVQVSNGKLMAPQYQSSFHYTTLEDTLRLIERLRR